MFHFISPIVGYKGKIDNTEGYLTTNRQVEARGCAAEGAEGGGGAVAEGGGDTGGGEPVHQELRLSRLLLRARGLKFRHAGGRQVHCVQLYFCQLPLLPGWTGGHRSVGADEADGGGCEGGGGARCGHVEQFRLPSSQFLLAVGL